MGGNARGDGTPRRTGAGLDRALVVARATALADEHGLGAVTMRAVARGLGVEAMSLYHHVANKDALLDAMVEELFAQLGLPDDTDGWRAALAGRAGAVRELFRAHRWAVGLMESRRAPGPATLRHHDAVVGVLLRAGFTVPWAAHAFAALDSYVYGFAVQEAALPFTADTVHEVGARLMAGPDLAGLPHLVRLMTEHALRPGYDFGDEFGVGLGLLLDSLERVLARGGVSG